MSNKVEGGVNEAWLFNSLFGQFVCLFITKDVCVGSDFANSDVVVTIMYDVNYATYK